MDQNENISDSVIFLADPIPLNDSVKNNVPPAIRLSQSEKNIIGKAHKNEIPPKNESEELESNCPICFEAWTSSGPHRICALKCGHLFGKKCIERWLHQQATAPNKPRCPQCNCRASRRDIINIYSTNFSVVDSTEIDRYRNELEAERSLRLKSDRNLSISTNRVNMLLSEIEIMRSHNKNLEKKLNLLTQCQSFSNGEYCCPGTYESYRNYRINADEGCRILHWHHGSSFLLISKPSPTQSLLPGHGVYKMDFSEMDDNRFHAEYIKLHSSLIRDLCSDPNDENILLSCSQDKTLRLTNTRNNSHIHSYQTSLPAWSCHWDPSNVNVIYCGLNDGSLMVYDIRNTLDPVKKLELTREYFSSGNLTINKNPIVSIKSISVLDKNSTEMYKGLVAATFDGVYFIKNSDPQYESKFVLSTKGAVVYLNTNNELDTCVVTQRPSKSSPTVQHFIGAFTEDSFPSENNPAVETKSVSFNTHAQFSTGTSCTVMNRSSIYTPDGKNILVAVGNEDNKSVQIFNTTTDKVTQAKSNFGIILDVAPMWHNNLHYIAALTSSTCIFFKYKIN